MPPTLSRNALPLSQIVGSTLANIGPALGVFFNFPLLAQTAGVGVPLVVALAMLAILFLCNTVAEFSRLSPSAGSFVTFIGLAFGPAAAAASAVFVLTGYCIAAAGIVAIIGGWVSDIAALYAGAAIPWQPVSLAATVAVCALVRRGIALSTRWATLFFVFETALLAVCTLALLWLHRHFLSAAPFQWSQVNHGLAGLGLAFPFGVYLFVGWENSAMLAEEAHAPRRNVPRALYIGTLAVGLIYLAVAYAVEVAFHEDAAAIGQSLNPFLDAVRASVKPLAILVYAAGFTSLLSCMIGLTNAQARILFNSGRAGLLPAIFGRVHPRHHTPAIATTCFLGTACVVALTMGLWATPLDVYNQAGTFGTILLILTYMLANLALPVHVWRAHRPAFKVFAHLLAPLFGVALMLVPCWGLLQPGQPAPYNAFPPLALAAMLAASLYGVLLARRLPGLARRIGLPVADADQSNIASG